MPSDAIDCLGTLSAGLLPKRLLYFCNKRGLAFNRYSFLILQPSAVPTAGGLIRGMKSSRGSLTAAPCIRRSSHALPLGLGSLLGFVALPVALVAVAAVIAGGVDPLLTYLHSEPVAALVLLGGALTLYGIGHTFRCVRSQE